MNNVTDRNIQTLSEALKQVRAALDAQHEVNDALRDQNALLKDELARVEQRVNQVYVKLYSGGATNGNNN